MTTRIRFLCPTCKAVMDAPVDRSGKKIHCLKCGQRLQVPPPEHAQTILAPSLGLQDEGIPALPVKETPVPAKQVTASPAPALASPSAFAWHYLKNGKQFGPVSHAELQQMALRGQLSRSDRVWRQGMPNWLPAEKINGLFGPCAATVAAPAIVEPQSVMAQTAVPARNRVAAQPMAFWQRLGARGKLAIAAIVAIGLLLLLLVIWVANSGRHGSIDAPGFTEGGGKASGSDQKKSFSYDGMQFECAVTSTNSLTIAITGKPKHNEDMIVVVTGPGGEREIAGQIDHKARKDLNIYGKCKLAVGFSPLKAGDYTVTLKNSDGSRELWQKIISITDGKATIEDAGWSAITKFRVHLAIDGDIPIYLGECILYDGSRQMKGMPEAQRHIAAGLHVVTFQVFDRPDKSSNWKGFTKVSLSYGHGGSGHTAEYTVEEEPDLPPPKLPYKIDFDPKTDVRQFDRYLGKSGLWLQVDFTVTPLPGAPADPGKEYEILIEEDGRERKAVALPMPGVKQSITFPSLRQVHDGLVRQVTLKVRRGDLPLATRQRIAIQVLGPDRYKNDLRFYLLERKEPAVTIKEIHQLFNEKKGGLFVEVILPPDGVGKNYGAVTRLRNLAARYHQTTLVRGKIQYRKSNGSQGP